MFLVCSVQSNAVESRTLLSLPPLFPPPFLAVGGLRSEGFWTVCAQLQSAPSSLCAVWTPCAKMLPEIMKWGLNLFIKFETLDVKGYLDWMHVCVLYGANLNPFSVVTPHSGKLKTKFNPNKILIPRQKKS